MKTLKKTLCLVLAVVMAVGVLVIPANAAFPDEADITHDEAVAVLNGLGILKGDDKGNFNPNEILTRAQAAKIIAYLMLGEDGAEDYVASSEPFTDMSGADVSWAVNYVAYCADNDIIGGNGDGTFNPKGELTGAAFAKMILCALGYDGEIEGFGGSNWTKNVESIARKVGLNSNITSFQYSASLTRDKAAQMAYNALKVGKVTGYTGGTNIELPGDVTITQGAERDVDLTDTLWNDFDLITLDGKTGTEMVNNGKDDFGRPSKYQIAINGSTKTVLYSQPISPVKVYTAASTKVATELKDYTIDSTDGVTPDASGVTASAVKSYSDLQGLTGNGKTVEVYATGKAITSIVVIQPVVAQITKTSSKITLTYNTVATGIVSGTVAVTDDEDDDNVDWYDVLNEYENKAYVLVVIDNNNDKTILSVEPITTISGKLTGTGTAMSNGTTHLKSYTIDGTKYNVAVGAKTTWTLGAEPGLSSKDDAIALVDNNKNIYDFLKAETTKTEVRTMYVVAAYESAGEWGPIEMFQGVLPTGEVITGEIYTDNTRTYLGASALQNGGGYKYSIDSKTGAYKFTSADVATSYSQTINANNGGAGIYQVAQSAELKTSDTRFNGKNYFAADVVFITVDGKLGALDVDVRDGRQHVNVSNNDYVVITEDGNKNLVVSAVILTDADAYVAPTAKGEDLLYFSSISSSGDALGADGETEVKIYSAYLNGEKVEVLLGKDDTDLDATGWYSYEVNEETGVYSIEDAPAAVQRKDDTNVTISLVGGVYYMSSTTATAFTDYDATDAQIFDLTTSADITTIEALYARINAVAGTNPMKLAYTVDGDGKTIDLIYVVDQGKTAEELEAE